MPQTFTRNGFSFTVEEYSPQRWRTLEVEGPIRSVQGSTSGKRKGNLALCQFQTANPNQTLIELGSHKFSLLAGQDGGHVIALDIGGIEHPANVVPMPSYFNRHGLWRDLERFLSGEQSGRSVNVRIVVSYPGVNPTPNNFTITHSYPDPSGDEPDRRYSQTQDLVPTVYARTAYSIPNPIFLQFNTHIPLYRRDNDLEDADPIPYAFLTWLNDQINPRIINPSSIVEGGKFTKEQKAYIWSLNCWNNNAGAQNGFLKSDIADGSDDHANLSTKGCLEFPQVDHKKPARKNGRNSFENCQLTSAWYNNKKRADYTFTDDDWDEFDQGRTQRKVRDTVASKRRTVAQLQVEETANNQRREQQRTYTAERNKKRKKIDDT